MPGPGYIFDQDYKNKLDGIDPSADATVVGDGLSRSGDTVSVRTTGDGSIVSGPTGLAVGEITDAQHGERDGGELHAEATDLEAGFMSAEHVRRIEELESIVLEQRERIELLTLLLGS